MASNLIMESYFTGAPEEWLGQLDENIVDRAIEILSINPNEEMEPTGYSPIDNSLFQRTVKVCLWKDLVQVIHRWGMPSPTKMQTSPSRLKAHADNVKGKLSEAVEVLESLQYEAIYKDGTLSKEFKFGYGLRQASELMRVGFGSGKSPFISPLDIKQQYESDGFWKNHYPIDDDIESGLKTLRKLIRSIDQLQDDPIYKPSEPGKRKRGKDGYDTLVWALCYLYKKYTGEMPISSSQDDGTASGKIIPFLQAILPSTAYSFELTDWALEQKIRRLKQHKIHGKLWKDGKK